MTGFHHTRPAACAHIADYYRARWEAHACIAFNLLARGYRQWANGVIETGTNNLYGEAE